MKFIYFVIVLSLLTYSLPAQHKMAGGRGITQKDSSSIQLKEFQKLTNDWANAYNTADTAKLKTFYSEDAEYISSHVSGLVASGRDKVIANFERGVKMGGHIDNVAILSMYSSCDLTTLLCKYEATNNGQKAIGRNLLVLKKIVGRWVIVTHMTVV